MPRLRVSLLIRLLRVTRHLRRPTLLSRTVATLLLILSLPLLLAAILTAALVGLVVILAGLLLEILHLLSLLNPKRRNQMTPPPTH